MAYFELDSGGCDCLEYYIECHKPESQILQIAHLLVEGNNFRQEVYFQLEDSAGLAGARAHRLDGEYAPRHTEVALLNLFL
jgi:hypothetical protein